MPEYTSTYPVEISVTYRLEDEIGDGRGFPVELLVVTFQGVRVTRTLAPWQILDLQREIFKSLTDEQKGKWAGFVGPYKEK
jgi:hypothetical protein|tara:strand:+ start:510 stop:752 length:243 start_codon:yes stop_codon:yes gene_type:complete